MIKWRQKRGVKMECSIIVPVYNCEDYLDTCLRSLVNQTLENIEIIIVDDGSSDNSPQIIKTYQEKYPQKIKAFYKENGGQGSARNAGLQHATKKYLGFVDSDDYVDETMYEQMVKLAEEHNYDVVICDMIDHYPTHDIYHHSSEFKSKFKQTPSACNKIFKAEICKDIQFPIQVWYEDFEFTTKILCLSDRLGRIHQGLYHCHCREISTMSNNNAAKNLDILIVLEHLQWYIEEHNLQEKYQDDMNYLIIEHALITTIHRVSIMNAKDKKQVIKKISKYVRQHIPNLKTEVGYQELPNNRKIIARLHFHNHYKIANFLLMISKKMKKNR